MKKILKKENIYKILYFASIVFLILYVAFLVNDLVHYNKYVTSFPFSTFVLARTVEFIIPCILEFLIGLYLKKRFNKKEEKK